MRPPQDRSRSSRRPGRYGSPGSTDNRRSLSRLQTASRRACTLCARTVLRRRTPSAVRNSMRDGVEVGASSPALPAAEASGDRTPGNAGAGDPRLMATGVVPERLAASAGFVAAVVPGGDGLAAFDAHQERVGELGFGVGSSVDHAESSSTAWQEQIHKRPTNLWLSRQRLCMVMRHCMI